MRCIIALLFGTALLGGAVPQLKTTALYWDTTDIAIVVSRASGQVTQDGPKLEDRSVRPPWGDMFALPEVSHGNGIKIGDNFDINLTGNFWVRATVNGFIHNKTEYQGWMLAIAAISPENQQEYAAAIRAKLHVFLAESAKPRRISDTGQIHNPLVKIDLSASERTALETNLNEIMMTKLHQAMRKEQSATPNDLLSQLLGGKAKLIVTVDQVDLGELREVRQHVLGTWTVGDKPVLSVQGWKRPDTDRLESVEDIDGLPEDKAEILGAISDWGEESLDDFAIENVFSGGRLVRHSFGYESSELYLEQMTPKGRQFERALYGL